MNKTMTNPRCRCGDRWNSHSDLDGSCCRCTCDQYTGDYPELVVEPSVSYDVEHDCEGSSFAMVGLTAEQANARRDELLADETVTNVKVIAHYS